MVNKDCDCSKYLSIKEAANYLNIKEKTLYARAAARQIPHYKIGRLLRFKKEEIDAWMHEQKVLHTLNATKAKDIFRSVKKEQISVDKLIRKSLDEVRCTAYSQSYGKPDRNVKGQTRKGDS